MEKLSIKQISILDRLYKDINSSTCFTSLEPLLREAKRVDKSITRDAVKKYLSTQNTYTLHRRAVRKYKRMRTLAAGLHTEWQADLSIFDRLSSQNKGFKYLLVCIDTLSRMIFVEPVKSKHSEKGYLPNFTDEIFVIKQVRLVPHQRPTYRLSDKKGELIRGWFYANDLCLVRERKKEDVLYDIEKVLKKRNFDGENQYFVKWKGYGTRFNSWIPASSVNWR
uniref:Chromo domain-containing protein n=2 Tax=Meloidogyne TaxID=189290 RepID=A0A6V7XVH2_MELEN|nr:unnamed protein product [Meloidogyne enterolobii]CAD2203332.1 unnamed protein product [Meloidogyne enterolobii]